MPGDNDYLQRALELAQASLRSGGFPVGALIVKEGAVLGEGQSLGRINNDPTAHAEIAAIRAAAAAFGRASLSGATLYSSLEPCVMCFASAWWAGISRVVIGCEKNLNNQQWFEGETALDTLNAQFRRSMEIVQRKDFTNPEVELLAQWEATQKP